jgi:hypothetical protein
MSDPLNHDGPEGVGYALEPESAYSYRHIWHFCKNGEHARCPGYGSLVERRHIPGRTFVEGGVRGHGFENVYCECPCHAHKNNHTKHL